MKQGRIIGLQGLLDFLGSLEILGLLGILGSLGLLGCTQESDAPLQQQRAIGFGSYTERFVTRGEVKGAIPNGGSIGVYAYYHDGCLWATDAENNQPNFMWNQKTTYHNDIDAFTYEPLKYWPNEESDKLSFIAYYPYTNPEALESPESPSNTGLTPNLLSNGKGLPSFDLEVKNTPENQVDILISDLITDLPQSRDTEGDPGTPFNDLSIYDKVKFVFHHALAKIEFRVVADTEIRKDLVKFKLKSLGITNIYNNGTLNVGYDAGNTTLNWSGQSTTHDYSFKTYEPQLLMPQTISDLTMLNLNYEITFKSDGTSFEYLNDGSLRPLDDYTYKNEASIQLNTMKKASTNEALTAWEANHHYIYTIRLRANRIEFTGEVVDWGYTDTVNDIPIEE